ncbi:MAG: Mov34/MPN/PAD-1 family protein [Leptonema sp. (in: bacteria)]
MIDWKDEEPDIVIYEFTNFDFFKINIQKEQLESFIKNHYKIFFLKKEWETMWTYGQSSDKELGGLLVGYIFSYEENWIRIIDQIVVSDDYVHSTTHLILYPSLWQKTNQMLKESNPNSSKSIIGWFHTHPNFSPFFSLQDKKTQENFFRESYSIGIVLDPFSKNYCVYETKDSILYHKPIIII